MEASNVGETASASSLLPDVVYSFFFNCSFYWEQRTCLCAGIRPNTFWNQILYCHSKGVALTHMHGLWVQTTYMAWRAHGYFASKSGSEETFHSLILSSDIYYFGRDAGFIFFGCFITFFCLFVFILILRFFQYISELLISVFIFLYFDLFFHLLFLSLPSLLLIFQSSHKHANFIFVSSYFLITLLHQ